MTPRITTDQRQAIEEQHGKPVYVLDADTNTSYVLVRADQYERVRTLFEDSTELDPREAYPLVDAVMQEDDANDPALAQYQRYAAEQP